MIAPVQGTGNPDVRRPAEVDADMDASRRTYLANERTQLAWWRTGLTAVAVALAVGKVVPDLGDTQTRWPYAAVGVGFAIYGVAIIAYGSWRARAADASLRAGRLELADNRFMGPLAFAGIGLAALTAVLLIID